MRIGLLVLDGCLGSAVATIVDIVNAAEGLRSGVDPSIPRIELSVAGPRKRVTASNGMVM